MFSFLKRGNDSSKESTPTKPVEEPASIADEPIVETTAGTGFSFMTSGGGDNNDAVATNNDEVTAYTATGFSFMSGGGGGSDQDTVEKSSISLSGFDFLSSPQTGGVGVIAMEGEQIVDVDTNTTSSFSFLGGGGIGTSQPAPAASELTTPVYVSAAPKVSSPAGRTTVVPVPKKVIKKRASTAKVGRGRVAAVEDEEEAAATAESTSTNSRTASPMPLPPAVESIAEEDEDREVVPDVEHVEPVLPPAAVTVAETHQHHRGHDHDHTANTNANNHSSDDVEVVRQEQEQDQVGVSVSELSYTVSESGSSSALSGSGGGHICYSSSASSTSTDMKAVMETATMTPVELLQHDVGTILHKFIDDVDQSCREHEAIAEKRRFAQELRENLQRELESCTQKLSQAEAEQAECAEREDFEQADALSAVIDRLTAEVAAVSAQLTVEIQATGGAAVGPENSGKGVVGDKELSASTLSPTEINKHVRMPAIWHILTLWYYTIVFVYIIVNVGVYIIVC